MTKILLAKYEGAGKPLDLREVDTAQGEYLTRLREAGFVDFVASEQPAGQPGKIVVESLDMVGGKLVQTWETREKPENGGAAK